MPWNHRAYATAEDPARQSDLNDIASPHGCSRRFQFRKNEQVDGTVVQRDSARWKMVHGSAIHRMIERALAPHAWQVLKDNGRRAVRHPKLFERLRAIYGEEVVAAAEGLPIDWADQDPADAAEQAATMVRELLFDLLERIERPLAVEAPFICEIDGYFTSGTIDLVYEPRGKPGEVGYTDWKSGLMRMHPMVLAHGYQVGIYATAVEHGVFFPDAPEGDERREMRFGKFPSEIFIVHLRELLPYAKRTTFTLERDEEVEWVRRAMRFESSVARPSNGVTLTHLVDRVGPGTLVEVEPSSTPPPKLKKDGTPYKRRARKREPLVILQSDRRGPAWYAAPRTADDVARLKVSLASIVGTVRLGRFYESIGEQCGRCPFRGPCLTDGHEVDRAEMTAVNRALAGVEGLDEVLDYAV